MGPGLGPVPVRGMGPGPVHRIGPGPVRGMRPEPVRTRGHMDSDNPAVGIVAEDKLVVAELAAENVVEELGLHVSVPSLVIRPIQRSSSGCSAGSDPFFVPP